MSSFYAVQIRIRLADNSLLNAELAKDTLVRVIEKNLDIGLGDEVIEAEVYEWENE